MKEIIKKTELLILSSLLCITFVSCNSEEKVNDVNVVKITDSSVITDTYETEETLIDNIVTSEKSDTEFLAPYAFWMGEEYRSKLIYDKDKFYPYNANQTVVYEEMNKIDRIQLRCGKCGEFCNEYMDYFQIVSSDIYSDEEIENLNNDAYILSNLWGLTCYCKTYDTPAPPIYRSLHFPDECRSRYNLDLWYMQDKDIMFMFADPDTLEELGVEDIFGEQWSDYVYNVTQRGSGNCDIREAEFKDVEDIRYFPEENVLSGVLLFVENKDGVYGEAMAHIIVPGDKAVQKYLVKSE